MTTSTANTASQENNRDTSPKTKHGAVANQLREDIRKGVWSVGERIPSEQIIAKQFGVAYMTARQAISSLVAEGVLERVSRKGTFVAPTQTSPSVEEPALRDRYIILVEGGKTSIDPYYFPPIVEALEREIRCHGYDLSIYDYSMAILNGLIAKEATVCCILLNEPEVLYTNLLRERGNKVVAINRLSGQGKVPFVAPDNVGGAQRAVDYLVGLGHRSIGFVSGIPGNIDAADRRQGYIRGMQAHGLKVGPILGNHFVEASGYSAAQEMLSSLVPPTAIFCASDLSAIGAMKAIAEAGLSVPDDISVMGFGDFSIAGFWHPGLSTVRLPLDELGTAAARRMQRISEGEELEPLILPCELVLRESVSPPSIVHAAA